MWNGRQNKFCLFMILSIHSSTPTSHFFEKGRMNHLHLLGNCCYLIENPPRSQRMENGLYKWLQIAMIPFGGQMPRIVTESNILSHRTFLLLCSCIFSKMYHYVSSVATNAEPKTDSAPWPYLSFLPVLYPIKLHCLLEISPVTSSLWSIYEILCKRMKGGVFSQSVTQMG